LLADVSDQWQRLHSARTVQLTLTSQGELISSSLLLHSAVVKLISLTKRLAEEKEISNATDAVHTMLLELSLIQVPGPKKLQKAVLLKGTKADP